MDSIDLLNFDRNVRTGLYKDPTMVMFEQQMRQLNGVSGDNLRQPDSDYFVKPKKKHTFLKVLGGIAVAAALFFGVKNRAKIGDFVKNLKLGEKIKNLKLGDKLKGLGDKISNLFKKAPKTTT